MSMYNYEKLRKELIGKLEKEQKNYLNEIKIGGVDYVIKKAYEIASRQEIIDYLSFSNIEPKDIKALLNTENVLGIFYDEWLETDNNFYEALEYPIERKIESISNEFYSDNKKEKNKNDKESR